LNFFWHDYETFGIDPQRDRPVQFAGVCTDEEFNLIDDPLVVYCSVPLDYLPQPEACLITGITPQLANQKGLPEAEFIRLIHGEFARPNTCALGYNTIRFDDEVTRNCLYRNFYDPYTREWQNGNSRWDLLDAIRAARALRPEGIHWPLDDQGVPTLRLDQLTIANGIAHEAAHDALADVLATIGIAKLLKQAQPKLYQFLLANRGKHEAHRLLKFGEFEPVVHVSGKYPTLKNNLAVVVALCKHPTNSNGVIVYDLSVDPEPLLTLSTPEIRQRLFTATADLPENTARIPLKTVHVNKCPVLAPVSVIRPQDAERLAMDLDVCKSNLQKIKSAGQLSKTLSEVFSESEGFSGKTADPDLAIYSGGFFTDNDKREMTKIRSASPEQLVNKAFHFNDKRLPEMLFRYRARNYPASLTQEETKRWKEHCLEHLSADNGVASINFQSYFAKLDELANRQDADLNLVNALRDFGQDKLLQLL